MSTFTQHVYQWVWGTRSNRNILDPSGQMKLYAYIAGLLKNKRCHPYALNGTNDHIHIVTSMPPSLSVSMVIKDIKLSTSSFIKRSGIFESFEGWQDGFGSFTYSKSALPNLINYVKQQKEHHRKKTFREEFIELLREHGVEFDDRYLF